MNNRSRPQTEQPLTIQLQLLLPLQDGKGAAPTPVRIDLVLPPNHPVRTRIARAAYASELPRPCLN